MSLSETDAPSRTVRCAAEHWILWHEYARDPGQPAFRGCTLNVDEFAGLLVADAALWEIPPLMQTWLVARMRQLAHDGVASGYSPSELQMSIQQLLYSGFATRMILSPSAFRTWYGWATDELISQLAERGEFVFFCAATQCAVEVGDAVFWRLRPELVRHQEMIGSMHQLIRQRTLDHLLLWGGTAPSKAGSASI